MEYLVYFGVNRVYLNKQHTKAFLNVSGKYYDVMQIELTDWELHEIRDCD